MLFRFIKNIFLSVFVGFLILQPLVAFAIEQPTDTVRIEVFERQDCGHCQDEKAFLNHLADERGYLLNEYGLFKDGEYVAGETEKEVFEKLGLSVKEPKNRK